MKKISKREEILKDWWSSTEEEVSERIKNAFAERFDPNSQLDYHLKHSRFIDFLYKKGIEFKNIKKLIFIYEKIIHISPHSNDAFYNLGHCSFQQKEYKKAVDYFTKSINLETPNEDYINEDTDTLIYRGRSYMELKEYHLALKDFNESLKIKESPHGLHCIGICYSGLKQYSKSINFLQKSFALRKTDSALFQIAYCYDCLKLPLKAIEFYTKALHLREEKIKSQNSEIQINRGTSVTHNNRGLCYMKCGMFDLAEKDYSIALYDGVDVSYPYPLKNKGILYFLRKDYKKAMDCYDRALYMVKNGRNKFVDISKEKIHKVNFYKALVLEINGEYAESLMTWYVMEKMVVKEFKEELLLDFEKYYNNVNSDIIVDESFGDFEENKKRVFGKMNLNEKERKIAEKEFEVYCKQFDDELEEKMSGQKRKRSEDEMEEKRNTKKRKRE